MEDNSIIEKQNYLREVILDKGYDTTLFTTFLEKKDPEAGIDINKWTIEQLQIAVDEFCAQYEPTQDFTNNNTEDNIDNAQTIHNEIYNNNNHNNIPNNIESNIHINEVIEHSNDNNTNIINNHNELTFIKCLKIGETEISKTSDVNVTVSFPEIVEAGFFSSKYVTYLVSTSPFDFKVRRRYSDFVWLREFFKIHFVFSALPPLPKKNYSDRFSDFLIMKRSRALQKFMNGIITNPLIRNSHALFDFLSIEHEEEWCSKKAEYDQKKPQTMNLNKLITLTGKLDCTLSPEKESKINTMKENITQTELLFKQLLVSYKEVLLSLVTVSDKMRENAEIWNQLHSKSVQFKDHQKIREVYHTMNKLMDEWGSSLKNQVSLINLNLREFFRYAKNEYAVLKDKINQCDTYRTLFYKAEERLHNKKEDLYKRQDILKWDLEPLEIGNKVKLFQNKEYAFSKMLPKETQNVKNIKYTYAACLNAITDEYNRIQELNEKRFPKQMCVFSNSNAKIITEFHVAHVDVIAVNA